MTKYIENLDKHHHKSPCMAMNIPNITSQFVIINKLVTKKKNDQTTKYIILTVCF